MYNVCLCVCQTVAWWAKCQDVLCCMLEGVITPQTPPHARTHVCEHACAIVSREVTRVVFLT